MFAKRFWNSRSGSVLPMFGIAALVIFGAVGAAVDYSRAGAARTELQGVLDAVALILSKDALQLTKKDLNARADELVNAMLVRPEVKNLKVTPQFVADGNTFKLTMTGSMAIDSSFARLFGVKKMNVGTDSVVAWEMRRMELVLALDNTGSMSTSGKMKEMQKAVKVMLKTLKKSANSPDQIKVSIVPFDTVVNVGVAHKDATWMRFDMGVDKDAWQGCVTDRDQPYDAQDAPPTAALTQFPAVACTNGSSLSAITPLTSDWAALDVATDKMKPNGNTNVSIGLAWAWHTLTSGVPLSEAAAPKGDLDKVIVLLTDGLNTQNRWTGVASQIDARLKATCDNVKATGIKLYTIRVIEGNASLLQDCASTPSMFYNVEDAAQLNTVFNAIAQNLSNIRIAK